jgi:mobilome CxxCx(11)CxxC protein
MIAQKINQKRLDALAVKYVHEQRLSKLRRLNRIADILAFGVPAAYYPVRLAAKGTPLGLYAEGLWTLALAALAFLSAQKMVSRWQDNAERHSRLIGENISLATQADSFLARPELLSPDATQAFFNQADLIERQDRDALGPVPRDQKQHAFREALKESAPSSADVKCPVCNASPWQFKAGTCDACGNTPVESHK